MPLTALETELSFEELIERVIVLAGVGVVFLVIGAHHGGNTCLDGFQEL